MNVVKSLRSGIATGKFAELLQISLGSNYHKGLNFAIPEQKNISLRSTPDLCPIVLPNPTASIFGNMVTILLIGIRGAMKPWTRLGMRISQFFYRLGTLAVTGVP